MEELTLAPPKSPRGSGRETKRGSGRMSGKPVPVQNRSSNSMKKAQGHRRKESFSEVSGYLLIKRDRSPTVDDPLFAAVDEREKVPYHRKSSSISDFGDVAASFDAIRLTPCEAEVFGDIVTRPCKEELERMANFPAPKVPAPDPEPDVRTEEPSLPTDVNSTPPVQVLHRRSSLSLLKRKKRRNKSSLGDESYFEPESINMGSHTPLKLSRDSSSDKPPELRHVQSLPPTLDMDDSDVKPRSRTGSFRGLLPFKKNQEET